MEPNGNTPEEQAQLEAFKQLPIPELVVKVLQANPQGLTKEEILSHVSYLKGREVKAPALKLGDLGLEQLIKVEVTPRQVTVVQDVSVFKAV